MYRSMVRFLSSKAGVRFWDRVMSRRYPNARKTFPEYIGEHVGGGRTFADVGSMWVVNGAYSFAAEEAGASRVVAVDVTPATPEFEEKRRARSSKIEFVHGDITLPQTMAAIGVVDVVFCAGVLHHHPSPLELMLALREICGQKLIFNTATIPEMPGILQGAVYYPMLSARDRKIWDQYHRGARHQIAVQTPYDEEGGYANWFWGTTPSCVAALLQNAGFRIDTHDLHNPFASTFVCTPTTKAVEELRGRLRIPGGD